MTILEVLQIPQYSYQPFSNINSSAACCAKTSVLQPKELHIYTDMNVQNSFKCKTGRVNIEVLRPEAF